MPKVNRCPIEQTITIAPAEDTSSALGMGRSAMAILQPLTEPSSTEFTVHGATRSDLPFAPIRKEDQSEVAAITWDGTNALPLPAEIAKYPVLKIVTDEPEDTELEILVVMKS